MSDKEARKYFENMPYGKDAKSSEIHGKESQQVINQMVSGLVEKYDESMATGDNLLHIMVVELEVRNYFLIGLTHRSLTFRSF